MLMKADENGTHQPVSDVVQRANKLGAFCKCLLFGSFGHAKKDWICKQAASVHILKWKARPVSLCFVFRLCLGAGQVLQGDLPGGPRGAAGVIEVLLHLPSDFRQQSNCVFPSTALPFAWVFC